MDHTNLTALVRRAQELAAQASVSRPALTFVDEKDAALAHYRTIAGLCAQAIERLRPQDGEASPELVEAVQVFLQIARLCTNEHDRICQADAARRERQRRWSVFQQIFADHWEAFQHAHPRYQTPYYDGLVAKMLACGNPEKIGYIEYRCLHCGQGKHLVAMSCKSSLCLRCAKVHVDNWVSQVSKVLHEGVIYWHIVH